MFVFSYLSVCWSVINDIVCFVVFAVCLVFVYTVCCLCLFYCNACVCHAINKKQLTCLLTYLVKGQSRSPDKSYFVSLKNGDVFGEAVAVLYSNMNFSQAASQKLLNRTVAALTHALSLVSPVAVASTTVVCCLSVHISKKPPQQLACVAD